MRSPLIRIWEKNVSWLLSASWPSEMFREELFDLLHEHGSFSPDGAVVDNRIHAPSPESTHPEQLLQARLHTRRELS
jgi:hypothetical protein